MKTKVLIRTISSLVWVGRSGHPRQRLGHPRQRLGHAPPGPQDSTPPLPGDSCCLRGGGTTAMSRSGTKAPALLHAQTPVSGKYMRWTTAPGSATMHNPSRPVLQWPAQQGTGGGGGGGAGGGGPGGGPGGGGKPHASGSMSHAATGLPHRYQIIGAMPDAVGAVAGSPPHIGITEPLSQTGCLL